MEDLVFVPSVDEIIEGSSHISFTELRGELFGSWWLRCANSGHLKVVSDGYIKNTFESSKKHHVRPAASRNLFPELKDLSSKELDNNLGKHFPKFGRVWELITRDTLLCTTSIGMSPFCLSERQEADYEASLVRLFCNEWLKQEQKKEEEEL